MSESGRAKLRVGVLASGRGTNLQAIIDASEAGKIDARVVMVISDKKDASALERARNHNIPAVYMNPKDFIDRADFDIAVANKLKEYDVELIALAGYMRIVTTALINPFRERILNIHPSLLPSFPGVRGQRQALEYGTKVAGCTVHIVEEGMDEGPIVIQAVVPVLDGDDEESLAARILEQEHRIYPQAVQYFAEGRVLVSGRRVLIKDTPSIEGVHLINPPLSIDL